MTMTAVSANPQQLRERLLQATDSHSNIRNMVAVLDVISDLEKYPITKEALEETRLGKLINDLRKKTRDEDLARRAKKLLRNWQKLIEPQQNEILQFRTQSLPGLKSIQNETDNDKKPVFPSTRCSNTERLHDPLGEQKEEKMLQTGTITKPSVCGQIAALSSASESAGGAEPQKAHINSLKLNKEGSASAIYRTTVLQHQGQVDTAAPDTVKHKPTSHLKPPSPRPVKQLVANKRPTMIGSSDSEPLVALPLNSFIKGVHSECQQSKDFNDSVQNNDKALEQIHNLPRKSKGLKRHQLGLLSEVTNMETEKDMKASEGKKRKSQLKDYPINQERRSTEDTSKPRVKNRKLTFDPITQQIKASTINQSEEQHNSALDKNETVNLKPSHSASSPSPLHKMNWKELAQNDIIKYYLNLQNNLLKTSGGQTPTTDCFKTEHLKCEEDFVRQSSHTCFPVPDFSDGDLPGISRDVTAEDVNRVNKMHWPGVNGCQDSKGNWYGWTECISLDAYGDGSRLDILPYVCID
ncbi:mediator of RNA polymerase II transcription subunit 26-like [Trichomycterus rosablanca]|uniref:mediator of RNA polymerase II transcription subunit 26-like n=1 Tax=Trichomycterus rosablanca TaxID=2290929 RepID=UPI002F35DE51